ncbi:unnamed protein product [Closterium sp. Yama58-4]|nr:unnamed protein product [Closterium sp. Yama58-4]
MPSGWPMSDEPLLRLARSVVAIEEAARSGQSAASMVKRSKKSKSKRVTLRQKYKVIRKVKEHAKKKLKEAKKARRDGVAPRRRVEKDPGIPNDWPFREEELAALEARRQRALEEREAKKAEKKERARRRRAGLPEEGPLPGAEGEEDEEDAEMGGEGRRTGRGTGA